MALTPEAVGLKNTGRRRTPGLRREEVAALSGTGLTWYTWLEQGRDIRVSPEFLERVARTLQLSKSDTAYLFSLAKPLRALSARTLTTLPSAVQITLDAMTLPAFVLSDRFDVLGFNGVANAIYEFDAFPGPLANNHLWRYFNDPGRRELFPDWESFAHAGISLFRTNYAKRIGAPEFEALISSMQKDSPLFAHIWNKQSTASLNIDPVRMKIKKAGTITVQSVKFAIPELPDSVLYVLVPSDAKAKIALKKLTRNVRR